MEDLAHWLKTYMILSVFAYNNNNHHHNNYKGRGGWGIKKKESNNDKFFGFCLTFCKHDWQDYSNKTEVTKSIRNTEQQTKWKK